MTQLESQIHDASEAISKMGSRKNETTIFRFPMGFESVALPGRRGNPLRNRFWNLLDFFAGYPGVIRLEIVCEGQAYAFDTTEAYDSWRNSRENHRLVATSVNILVSSN